MNAPRTASVLTAEALGTFLFFFVGAGAVVLNSHTDGGAGGLLGVALAQGLVLAVLVSSHRPHPRASDPYSPSVKRPESVAKALR